MVLVSAEIVAQRRETTTTKGKSYVRRLRRHGLVPAILYGHRQQPVPLQLSLKDLKRMLARSEGKLIARLRIEGEPDWRSVVMKEIRTDPLTGAVLHVDFQEISLTERLRLSVPVTTRGDDAVATRGGIVHHLVRELTVEGLPDAIPEQFVLDISDLDIGDHLTVADLEIPPGVTVLADRSETLVAIAGERTAIEEQTGESTE